MTEPGKPQVSLARRDEFTTLFGMFHLLWLTLDLTTDYAICKFLKVTHEEGHLITSGMMFGRKARLLADLIGQSEHPNKSALLGSFNAIRGKSKRDIFAHGYLWSSPHEIRFIERSISGPFKAIEHKFTFEEFQLHCLELASNSDAFYYALGATREELNAFANAALSLNRKSKTSPGKPVSKM